VKARVVGLCGCVFVDVGFAFVLAPRCPSAVEPALVVVGGLLLGIKLTANVPLNLTILTANATGSTATSGLG
jgi:uncharacterized protein (UPF0212 family)